ELRPVREPAAQRIPADSTQRRDAVIDRLGYGSVGGDMWSSFEHDLVCRVASPFRPGRPCVALYPAPSDFPASGGSTGIWQQAPMTAGVHPAALRVTSP